MQLGIPTMARKDPRLLADPERQSACCNRRAPDAHAIASLALDAEQENQRHRRRDVENFSIDPTISDL
jgi:hypothetical protein